MSAVAHPDAEDAVLGALLLHPESLTIVRPILATPVAFTVATRAEIYRAILALYDRGKPFDHVTLAAETHFPEGQEIDPIDVLADLLDAATTAANIETHAQLVLDAWRRRQTVAEAKRLEKVATDPSIPLASGIAETCERLVPIGHGSITEKPRSLTTIFLDTLEDLERRTRNGQRVLGVTTGFEALDEYTDGWQPGSLTILAARPSQGKTALGLHMAKVAARTGVPVDIASLEMTADQLGGRMLQEEIGRDLRHLRRDAALFARYAPALDRAMAELSRLVIHIDTRSRSAARIRLNQQALMAQRGRPTGLLVIDYLGLMDTEGPQQNRDRELGSITKALKEMAKDLEIPVLLLAQLNRSNVRESRPPELHDLRDSGNIEQDADDVLMLHWPEGKPERGAAPVDLYARKVRNGHTGKVPLTFEPWTQRWFEAGAQHQADEPAA